MLGLHNRFQAFIHAFRGIVICLTREAHSRFHLCAAAVVIALATFLRASIEDWCWFVTCIGLVLAFEAINTSIERLADRVSEEYHDLIRDAKDLAAGAVYESRLRIGPVSRGGFWWLRFSDRGSVACQLE